MKRAGSIETYEAMRRAFRDLTDVGADGAPTRARVLSRASRDLERRARVRRFAVPIAATLIMSGTVSAALAVVNRWRAPLPIAIESAARAETGTEATSAQGIANRAVHIIPFERAATLDEAVSFGPRPRSSESISAGESRAYGRAHQAHFAEDAPARALAAWDAYLAAYPHGTFAPEATYNRAICLIRLERHAEAARVLSRLAAAPPGGYRREEALRLLDWLGTPVTDRSSR